MSRPGAQVQATQALQIEIGIPFPPKVPTVGCTIGERANPKEASIGNGISEQKDIFLETFVFC